MTVRGNVYESARGDFGQHCLTGRLITGQQVGTGIEGSDGGRLFAAVRHVRSGDDQNAAIGNRRRRRAESGQRPGHR